MEGTSFVRPDIKRSRISWIITEVAVIIHACRKPNEARKAGQTARYDPSKMFALEYNIPSINFGPY